MTATVDMAGLSAHHTSHAAGRRARRRYWAEARLKAYGIIAITLAGLALLTLVSTVVTRTLSVVSEDYLVIDATIEVDERGRARVDNPNPRAIPSLDKPLREALEGFVGGDLGRSERRQLARLLSGDAGLELGQRVKDEPSLIGRTVTVRAVLDDEVQMYLQGAHGDLAPVESTGSAEVTIDGEGPDATVTLSISGEALTGARRAVAEARNDEAARAFAEAGRQANAVRAIEARLEAAEDDETRAALTERLAGYEAARDAAEARATALAAKASDTQSRFELASSDPSLLIRVNDGWVKATALTPQGVTGQALTPLSGDGTAEDGAWQAYMLEWPESARNITDRQVVWLADFAAAGRIESALNTRLLRASDSSNAELAGIWGALVGSFWTMMVTLAIAFPVGVLTSIYLEEFAPRNRLTDFIEVNINNLAAVPSIVFGLLGLAIFVSGIEFEAFGQTIRIGGFLPRSSPLAGGAVLALMTLPTIIIAARASIRAVPPSIRDAALGLGASRLQTATHHVLPLAMPGILTGAILGMAQALGETAPLLLVGMNSFIQEPPATPLDPANVLPTLIYQWNNNPERLFDQKTAAAISILLLFLVAMNALAVLLRKRFERRW